MVRTFWLKKFTPRPRLNSELIVIETHRSIGGANDHTSFPWGEVSIPPTDENYWLVDSTHLKKFSQIGKLLQIGVKIKKI